MAYSKWLKKPGGQRLCILSSQKKSPTLWILDSSCETIGISSALKATPLAREMCPMFGEIQSFHAKKAAEKSSICCAWYV
jgi:hypothetical protein